MGNACIGQRVVWLGWEQRTFGDLSEGGARLHQADVVFDLLVSSVVDPALFVGGCVVASEPGA